MELNNKSILITGGTGSFGKRFIKVLLEEYSPSKIIIYSRDELKQFEMKQNGFDQDNLRYFIGDVRDYERLRRAFEGVDIVIHAAALKQVPACEYNPMEAIKTNIIGCSNVIDAALDVGVKKVIGLSTDKAVNPINLYGATKLAGEKLFIQSNAYAGGMHTRFSCVRYGNVIGSRGSVVPLILAQKNSGKISITDKRMTRFWITLNHGAHFVIDCLKDMNGGEVFIPKIPSMKIMDLAKVIAPESKIDFIGIRPGEKLHEVLISEDEARFTIELEKMYLIQPDSSFWFGKGWEGKGKKIPEGFTYTSNNNPSWLNEIEIRKLINSYE
jgi:UDP-N-acetylglucosamine 4,6-dehydratase